MAVRDALAWLRQPPAYAQHYADAGMCLANTRYAFNIPARYSSAAEAAQHAELHPGAKAGSAPRNRPYFWSGGSHGYGHVAITDGYTKVGRNLRVWTVDWPSPVLGRRDGKWRRVRADKISKVWGLKPLGWSDSLNGVKIDV